ncbi:AGE family epimerase/isomerase [Paenibacillus flagellatus]|uniref:N-acylglucosamine 2-epimerase n=1 Tax=Paenibacillus flagellatus TaxID=2211139 RepID=A0A2V5K0H4_9BACL|nr:AGE family epimerase/isomerase [Paenibacillus flagellatus]PYI52679.1 N-acylglucosamine 2-epimerase [Paenibacillus flagellatus]
MRIGNDSELLEGYKEHLHGTLLPFWWSDKALDREHGGVFTCFSNDGATLTSTDKYVWSQGRFVWVLARLADAARRGVVEGDADGYLRHAALTVGFLKRHALMANGNCAYLLTRDGEKKEVYPGKGYDISLFVDCFVAMGFAEYGRVAADGETTEAALRLFDSLERRIAAGDLRSEPYTLSDGYRSHSIPMIMLNVAQTVHEALLASGHSRADELSAKRVGYAEDVLTTFFQPDDTVAEVLRADGSRDADWVVSRHLNPGHALEDMWFLLHEAEKEGRADWIDRIARAIRKAYAIGWDDTYGGLLHYVDCDGGEPKGEDRGTAFDANVRQTWDTKLWWAHSEALYTTLLAGRLTGDAAFAELYARTHDYVFRTFPNPDRTVGEWIQIRDRQGRPLDQVVALPVKDPYHIIRNVLLIVERLSDR